MASRADNKCGSCYKELREGPTVSRNLTTVKIVLCDDCYDKWESEDLILPAFPLTEGFDYGTIQ